MLWGREALLDAMPPFLGGGNMIADVRLDGFTPAELPAKFEAGTPPITEAVGFGAPSTTSSAIGMDEVRRHEMEMAGVRDRHADERYGDDITIHGPRNVEVRGATLSFAFRGIHPHDLSQVLDQRNVCIRAGHHCAKPLMRDPRRDGHGAGQLLPLQRRSRRRRPGRRARRRQRHLRLLTPATRETTTMPGLEDLYREIILDHYRTPRNRGELPRLRR